VQNKNSGKKLPNTATEEQTDEEFKKAKPAKYPLKTVENSTCGHFYTGYYKDIQKNFYPTV
jgi:hypothetical protein